MAYVAFTRQQVGRCNTCGAEIIWLKSRAGKPYPVEYEDIIQDPSTFEDIVSNTDFHQCPDRDDNRYYR